MDKFSTLTGIAAPMPLVNIDTDMIIPIQHLVGATRQGLGQHAFERGIGTTPGAQALDHRGTWAA